MSFVMRLTRITKEGTNELITIDTGDLLLGRDTENSIVVDEEAVSRIHANIFEAGGFWFYRDLNSTNGSAINDVKVTGEQTVILRSNDIINLALFKMKFEELEERDPSLLCGIFIFVENVYDGSVNLFESGSVITVGNEGSDLVVNDGTSFQIFNEGGILKLKIDSNISSVKLNFQDVTQDLVPLCDKDEITFGNYSIVVNNPASIRSMAKVAVQTNPLEGKVNEWERTGESANKTNLRNRPLFQSTEETQSMSAQSKSNNPNFGLNQMGLSQRMGAINQIKNEEEPDPEKEQKHVYVGLLVLIFIVLAVITFIIFF
ncbi:MAG: FHA domain-containing protein [Proteobacteria bacterium]|nr:FHA domain-containing protein [Pseudomonadota bacterium]